MALFKGLLLFFVVLICLPNNSAGKADQTDLGEDAEFTNVDDHQILGENGDDQLFGIEEEFNSVHYANDDPNASGDDDDNFFIPVPEKPVLPKSQPKPEPDAEVTEANTETAEVTVEHTSFKPVEFNFEHRYPVLSGEQSTKNPEHPDDPVKVGEPVLEEENEVDLDEKNIKGEETVQLKSVPTKSEEGTETGDDGVNYAETELVDNSHEYNETNGNALGETTKRTHRNGGLSNIAKIGIAMGCVVVFWLLLCPVVCIVCRRKDKKNEKRAEEYKLKNGVPHHQHPLVEELVLSELGQNGTNHQANGKQKLYGSEAHSAEELQRLSNQSNASNHSNHSDHVVAKKPFPGRAPLASSEALDTEV